MRTVVAVPCLVATMLTVSAPAAVAQTWREVKGEHFTVVSDSAERRARSVAWQFEQMQAAIGAGFPWMNTRLDLPVVVLAARDENSMRALVPQYWEQRLGLRPASVFVSAADAHYIVLRADAVVEDQLQNPHAAAYWSYSAFVLQRSLGGRLPLWLTNGLATLLSNTIVRPREIEFGRPQPWVAELAKNGPRLPLAELFQIDRQSSYYRGAVGRERFDAQTWAFVQYLIFGHKDNGRGRFGQLVERLASGTPSEEALTAAYGDLAALEQAYTLYVHQGVYQFGRLPANAAIAEDRLPTAAMSAADSAAVRAALHVAMDRPVEARAMIALARKADPASPAADTAEAILLDHEQRTDEARALFTRATQNGAAGYWWPYYRLAALRSAGPQTTEDHAAVAAWLERATTLNPKSARAWALLADVQWRQGRTDDAVTSARRAAERDPEEVMHHVRLAQLLVVASRAEEARAVAARAMPMATAEQKEMLEALLTAPGR